jgi:hypothetical protein
MEKVEFEKCNYCGDKLDGIGNVSEHRIRLGGISRPFHGKCADKTMAIITRYEELALRFERYG